MNLDTAMRVLYFFILLTTFIILIIDYLLRRYIKKIGVDWQGDIYSLDDIERQLFILKLVFQKKQYSDKKINIYRLVYRFCFIALIILLALLTVVILFK